MSVYIIDKGNGIHQENNINTYIRTRVPPLNIIPLQQNKEYTENDAQCKQRTIRFLYTNDVWPATQPRIIAFALKP